MKLVKGSAAALLVAAMALPTSAMAADDDVNPWTDCGLGAMIFSDIPWAAAISNVVWDLGTTAVTSAGTSRNTCEGKHVAAATFVNETYSNLEQETVIGHGEHLTAMLNVVGCEASSHQQVIDSVRSGFASSLQQEGFEAKTQTEKAQQYYNIVMDNVTGEYASQCQVI